MKNKTPRILFRLLGVKLVLLAISVLSFSLFINPKPVQADTLTVCASGCDYTNIQDAIDHANPGDTIAISTGIFTNPVTINKSSLTLQGAGAGQTHLQGDGTSCNSAGIALSAGISNTLIADLTISGFQDGIQLFTGPISNTLIEDVETISNCRHGIYSSMSSGFSSLTLRRVNASYNNIAWYGRGIWVINGVKKNISIEDGVFNHNGLVGIDISDGNVSGLLISHNEVISNGDAGIAALGPQGSGATLIVSNTLVNNGRFGIEIKNPTGNGNSSGPGSVLVSNNVISRSVSATDMRDHAGIIVFRRYPTSLNADQPSGVVISGNRVSGYRVAETPGATGEGFGIVLEGANHTAAGNTLKNNDIGIQLQAGNPGLNDQNTPYFDRGDAANTAHATIISNAVSHNQHGIRSIGPVTGSITANLVYSNTQNGLTILDEASTSVLINDNQICHNVLLGVENKSLTSTVNALNNWWGAIDGPGPVGPGSGDKVGSRVAFVPFNSSNPNGLCKDTSVPFSLTLTATPTAIIANGLSTTTLTAVVENEGGAPVPDGTPVVFSTTLGHLNNLTQRYTSTTTGGTAHAILGSIPASHTITATVQATSYNVSGQITVPFIAPALVCRSDAYEPDNDSSQAQALALSSNQSLSQTHTFHTPDDEDWLKLNAQPGANYTFTLSNQGSQISATLALYADAGSGSALLPGSGANLTWSAPITPLEQTLFLAVTQNATPFTTCDTGYTLLLTQSAGGNLDNPGTEKSVEPAAGSLKVGDLFTYTITLSNSSASRWAAPVTVTDALPISMTLTHVGICTPGAPITPGNYTIYLPLVNKSSTTMQASGRAATGQATAGAAYGAEGAGYVQYDLTVAKTNDSFTWTMALAPGSHVALCVNGQVSKAPWNLANTVWAAWNNNTISRSISIIPPAPPGNIIIYLPVIMKNL